MLRHVFAWRVAPGHDADEIIEILNTLPRELPELIKGWSVGQHSGDTGENGSPWDGALITDFESWEGLEAYNNDPYHLEVIERLLPMFSDRAVVDFETQES
ncbi:hypothetical protein GCM10027062_45320 [Nocardioides hungaricus]